MRGISARLRTALLLPGLLLLAFTANATVRVSVDGNPVVDESFQLVFSSDESISAPPDFSPLEHVFTILSSSNRSSIRNINGRVSASGKWILTVMANQPGEITVPPIAFGNTHSPAVKIKVPDRSAAPASSSTEDIFIEVNVDKTEPYVQAQVVYTVKLFRAVPTSNESLSEPEISGGQTVTSILGDEVSYEVRRNGKRYVVNEIRYAIFPQNSGQLEIEPIRFRGETGSGGFFRNPFGPAGKTIVRRSQPVMLSVKPIPDAFDGSDWLPASQLSIQEQWSVSPDKLVQGEPVTRTLMIYAEGLPASQLPELDDTIPVALKHYPERPGIEESPSARGLSSSRKQKMALIPVESGDIVLPALSLPWWNTQTRQMELAELPARTVTVQPAARSLPAVTTESDPRADEPIKSIDNSGINPGHAAQLLLWQGLSATFLVLWLFTLFLWLRARVQGAKSKPRGKPATSQDTRIKLLKHACKRNNAVAARQALLAWARQKWPSGWLPSTRELQSRVNPEFRQAIDELDKHLYGRQSSGWDGAEFFRLFQAAGFQEAEAPQQPVTLEPLYKL